MSSQGTPDVGLARIAALVFAVPKTLVAYCNAGGTLGPSSVAADLLQPSQANGYAPLALDGTWSFNGGIATYAHPAGPTNDGLGNPCWVATGAWSATVTGVAMLDGNILQHFMDLHDGAGNPATFVAAAGKKLTVDISQLTV